ncbi:hypothetical protein SAMN02910356_01961 [Selenomonas sp. GACV-9]|uniref:DUF6033 family protein n=1 Tax=Selenomonas sp. GACV-9 TaxID=3158782 RepID=UPI0008DF4A61|nr:hypothetical protein SAMN02910356_01961 [Selenomonas ruminantium]
MANTIQHAGHTPRLDNASHTGKKRPVTKQTSLRQDISDSFGLDKDFSLSLSGSALSRAAQKPRSDAAATGGQQNLRPEEEKLSAKAKDYLAKLRDQYGDYDFIIADDVQNPLDVTGPSSKKYFVVLSTEEIERMAEDEDYAQEVMGKVESAIGTLNEVQEKGLLGEGVRFSRLAITFDEDGNTKLFAELERMSEEQQERLEKAMAKRAEEKKEAAAKAARPPLPHADAFHATIQNKQPPHHPPLEVILRLLHADKQQFPHHTDSNQQGKDAAPVHHKHGGHHPHVRHAGHAPEPPQAANTVRIEADSIEELLEKAQNIEWQ